MTTTARSEYWKKWSAQNKDKTRASQERYLKAHPERRRDTTARYRAKHASQRMMQKYGITLEQYDAMLAAQDGKCAICRRAPAGHHNQRKLHVDHDHVTGKVRGLLCSPCNLGIGKLGDDLPSLERAVEYLRRSRA